MSIRLPRGIWLQNTNATSQPAAAILGAKTATIIMPPAAAIPASTGRPRRPRLRLLMRPPSPESWPGLSRPSTSCLLELRKKGVDARDKRGHDALYPGSSEHTLGLRSFGDRSAPRKLQRADIGDDRPAVMGIDPIRIGIHNAVTFRDGVVEMRRGRSEQAIDVVGRRLRKPVRNDHAVAIAGEPVTGRAIDVEAFTAASEQRRRCVPRFRRHGGEREVALSHAAVRQRAGGSAVGPQRGGRVRLVLALLRHAEAAAAQQQHEAHGGRSASHDNTSRTFSAPAPCSESTALRLSSSVSGASMARKNRSWLARSVPSTANNGKWSRGRPVSKRKRMKPAIAAPRMPVEKGTSMKAGHEFSGRPPKL